MRPECAAELQAAETARQAGNEGMARVCARRAAGFAARAWLQQNRKAAAPRNAYQALVILAGLDEAPAAWRQAAEALTTRVNAEHALPPEMDLIAAARSLCEALR